MITMNRAQLCVARSLKLRGCPSDLMGIYLTRCGATQAEWSAMRAAGLVIETAGRIVLSDAGRRAYTKQKVGQYF